jgi:hypothetical protein
MSKPIKEKPKENYVMICPKCKSKEVTDRGIMGVGMGSDKYAYSRNHVCLTCGYQSPIFPEVLVGEADKLEDQPKNFNPSRLPIFADDSNFRRFIKYMREHPGIIVLLALLLFIISWLLLRS